MVQLVNYKRINPLISKTTSGNLPYKHTHTHTYTHRECWPEQHVSDRVRIRAQSYLDPKPVLSTVRDNRNLSWGVGVSACSHTGQLGPCVLVYIIWPE